MDSQERNVCAVIRLSNGDSIHLFRLRALKEVKKRVDEGETTVRIDNKTIFTRHIVSIEEY